MRLFEVRCRSCGAGGVAFVPGDETLGELRAKLSGSCPERCSAPDVELVPQRGLVGVQGQTPDAMAERLKAHVGSVLAIADRYMDAVAEQWPWMPERERLLVREEMPMAALWAEEVLRRTETEM